MPQAQLQFYAPDQRLLSLPVLVGPSLVAFGAWWALNGHGTRWLAAGVGLCVAVALMPEALAGSWLAAADRRYATVAPQLIGALEVVRRYGPSLWRWPRRLAVVMTLSVLLPALAAALGWSDQPLQALHALLGTRTLLDAAKVVGFIGPLTAFGALLEWHWRQPRLDEHLSESPVLSAAGLSRALQERVDNNGRLLFVLLAVIAGSFV